MPCFFQPSENPDEDITIKVRKNKQSKEKNFITKIFLSLTDNEEPMEN